MNFVMKLWIKYTIQSPHSYKFPLHQATSLQHLFYSYILSHTYLIGIPDSIQALQICNRCIVGSGNLA